MKIVLLLAALTLVGGQEPKEFPPGVTCQRAGPPVDHPCACHRICSDPTDPTSVVEDVNCKQYCHKEHCACPVEHCP